MRTITKISTTSVAAASAFVSRPSSSKMRTASSWSYHTRSSSTISALRFAPATTTAPSTSSSSSCSIHNQQHQHQQQQQPHQQQSHQQPQQRNFFTQIMNTLTGNSSSGEEEDARDGASLLEQFQEENTHPVIGTNVEEAMVALYEADTVCFDVDSTVINEEGIDVLADYLGQGPAVAKLTSAAMDGGMKFQDALKSRLDLLRPSKQQILACLDEHPFVLSPGIETLIATLHTKGVKVYLVSGGFRIMIEPVAKILNIHPTRNIIANTILFDENKNDEYAGFDNNEPTSQDMGKSKAVQLIMDNSYNILQRVVMVGDGATDAQAKPPATSFIGFGGVVQRQQVKDQADWFVTNFEDLTTIVNMRKTPTKPKTKE